MRQCWFWARLEPGALPNPPRLACDAALTSRASCDQGFNFRPVRPNRQAPIPVYRSGLAGYWSEPVEFKFEFKLRRSTGFDRYTGRLDRYTGRFVRYTGRFVR